ncbi:C40 family peptidase, partial [Arthrobacter pigmenti]
MSPTPRSEPRISSGFGRAAAVVAACGLLIGVGGTAVPLPTATEILASDDRWQQPGVVVPASAALSFRPYGSIMADGGFSTGTGPGLGGLPGVSASPGSPGFGAAYPGFPGGGGVPGGGLFAQPDSASVEGSLGNSLFAQPGPASAKGSLAAVVPYAFKGLGHRYVWGGTSFANGWDCSGFAQWAFAQAGFYLPRVSQWEVLAPTNTPRPGDLVTQRPDGPNHWAHVGIYIGDGMMISALNPDQGTIVHSVGPPGTSWYFTLPGNENIPYGAGERESGASVPRATPPVRFSVPSTVADTSHDGGNDGQDRTDNRRKASAGDNDRDRTDNRRKASAGDNDRDRPRHNADTSRDDDRRKSSSGDNERDRDRSRDNAKTDRNNGNDRQSKQSHSKQTAADRATEKAAAKKAAEKQAA